MSEIIYPDGLIESTEQDLQVFDECFSSAIPFTAMWRDANNVAKFMQWDAGLVEYLQHQQRLLDHEGRTAYLPWNIYSSKQLQWKNGLAPNQGQIGTCALMATMSSLNTSNLTNSVRTNIKPPEINSSVAYSAARGSGTPRWGSGCNLNPLSKWVAEIGNHLVSDVGAYDTSGTALRYANAKSNANALKHQSVIIYVPGNGNTPSFDDVFLACSAGFGVCMGTSPYPTEAKVGKSGLSEPFVWKNSKGHAMAWAAAMVESSRRFLYLLNSHGNLYDGDKYYEGRQPGCWISEENFARIANRAYRYGNWYVNIGELG